MGVKFFFENWMKLHVHVRFHVRFHVRPAKSDDLTNMSTIWHILVVVWVTLSSHFRAVGDVACIYKSRSPKGDMWSAIPVALLCMIVNWSKGKQGSGPEGDKVL